MNILSPTQFKIWLKLFLAAIFTMFHLCALGITTSWKGTTSTSWATSSNWTSGVPTATVDVIIGDANFTGANQPSVNSTASLKSLTIGNGTKVSTLTMGSGRNMTVFGNVIIGTNGTINHTSKCTFSLTGNFTNAGSYIATNNSSRLTFSGSIQSFSGSGTNSCKSLTINAGSTTSLGVAVNCNILSVSGTFDPLTYLITIAANTKGFIIANSGTIKVNTSTFSGNYSRVPSTINNSSTINYAATTINQSVAAFGYGKLVISGAMVKTLIANTTLLSATSTTGIVSLEGGTLDLAGFTLNRGTSVVGGTFTIFNTTTLRIGGTNTFPLNFQNSTIGTTSTVEYYGADQPIASKPYGNLLLSQSANSTKTMPTASTIISGNFTSNVLGGSMIITGAGHFRISGNFTLGANSTFNANAFIDTISGTSFINNGIIAGGTSRFVLTGVAAQVTGSGIFNFNDLELRRIGIAVAAGINLSISGNLSTKGSGTFTHITGGTGTITFTGTSKTISGTGIAFNNLTIAGTISSSAVFDIWGNLLVNASKSLTFPTGGIVNMRGSGKTITNNATLSFFELNIPSGASVTTATGFNMFSDLSVAGSLSASAGLVSFLGTSVLSGTANLFSVNLNGPKLTMGNNATLGIASLFSISTGTFDVITSTPNTVDYNGIGAQTISVNGYNRLRISGSNTKTAGTGLSINENLVIASGGTFNGGNQSHTLRGDWTNNGTFIPNTSTVIITGSTDAYIGGTSVTSFNNVTVNKFLSSLVVYVTNNINVVSINTLQGTVRTGTATLNITNTRTGVGYIYGIIKRTQTFTNNIPYEFEGQNNTITFTAGTLPTSVTVEVATDPVVGFPFGGSVNRLYNISVDGGGAYTATVRLHYLQGELNGNNEANMTLWRLNTGTWASVGKSSNSTGNDWLELTSLSDITNKWTFSEPQNVVSWTGATNTDWGTGSNWTPVFGSPSTPPGPNDFALLGNGVYTNQPTLGTSTSIRGIEFKSATATTLTLNGSGSLTLSGSIEGVWTADRTHTIAVGTRTLTINGDLTLGDGIINRNIDLTASTGTITVGNTLTQASGSIINLTGAANLTIGSDFIKTSTGAFNCGTSTTTFNGALAQLIPGVSYHNLHFNKTGGAASLGSAAFVNGNLTMIGLTSQLDLNANITVLGDVSFGALQTINSNSSTITVGGSWSKLGTFIQGSGNVIFNGTGSQTLSTMNFNNLIINKSADTLNLTGNVTINGDLSITAGTLDLKTFSCSRTALGGLLSLSAGTRLEVGGSSNFPSNFDNLTIPATSTVEYNSANAQTVTALAYGNLTFSNGGSVAKILGGSVTVNGDIKMNTNSTFDAQAFTIDLYGHWIDSGTFIPSTSNVIFSGGLPIDSTKLIFGRNSFYNVTVTGRYSTTPGTVITLLNVFTTTAGATYTQLSDSSYFYGNFFNSGTIAANGVTSFMGTRLQLIANNGTVTSNSSGVINYLGTVAPKITSTGNSGYYTLNILNTDPAGIAPTVPWTIVGTFSIGSGAYFNGGGLTHTFLGNFYNNGNISSSGTLIYFPRFGNTIANLGFVFNSSGLVRFIGNNKIDITGSTSPTFGALEISNTNVNGITPATDWTVKGNFTIFSGAKFYADAGPNNLFTLGGNFTNNGSFYGSNSTVVMTDTAAITGTGSITEFNNLTINALALDSALIDFSVSGNFTNNGTFTSLGYETKFIGANPAIIGGSALNCNFFDLTFSKASSEISLNSRINIEKDFTNNLGTQINLNTDSITIAGNWTNHGSYQDNISTNFATAYFNGAGIQTISGTAPTNFGNLNVNNSNGIVVASAQTVNGVLTLTNGDINSSGFLKLNLNRGAIAATGAGTISGNIVTTKSIPSLGYHYLSSPLNGEIVADWHDDLPLDPTSPRQNYYYYDETNTSADKALGWTPITATSYSLSPIKGFALYFPNATTNLDMTATYDHGTTSYSTSLTLTRSTPAGNGSDGWNLVGNPFPSPLDWDAASGWSKTNILNAIYCWDPSNNRYTSYIGGASANGGNKYIPAMQAFWVRLDTTGTTNKSISLGIANGTRVTAVDGSTPSIWRVAAPQNILKLTAKNEYNFDETIIRFQDSATIGFDGMFDAYKMTSGGNTPNFFSTINGNQYSINTLPMLGQEFKLALPLTAAKSGKMIIAADQIGAIDDNIDLILFDKTKNITQDLKENPNYSFDYDHTDTSTRFYLNMIPVLTGLQESQEPSIQIVEFNKILTVNFNHINDKTALVKVVDVLGRIVFETNEIDPGNKKYQKELSSLLPGVYLVEVQTSQKKMSSRILLR